MHKYFIVLSSSRLERLPFSGSSEMESSLKLGIIDQSNYSVQRFLHCGRKNEVIEVFKVKGLLGASIFYRPFVFSTGAPAFFRQQRKGEIF
ncbi:hypothetical protein G6M26_02940 [Agrobacterium tumefaciens]|nr:hypothetical protein [Agrobacterium tumefaciens]